MFYNKLARTLFILSVFAIVYILVYLYFLIDIPEVFPKAAEIGKLFYGFAISYIIAALFYFIVDFLPLRQRKKEILTNLEVQINNIERDVSSILSELDYPVGIERLSLDQIEKEELRSLLLNTRIDHRTRINYLDINQADIITHMERSFHNITQEISDLEKYADLFSPALFGAIKEIQRLPISNIIRVVRNLKRNTCGENMNLSGLANSLYYYVEKVQILREEWEKNKLGL